jgi:hypothetical protein
MEPLIAWGLTTLASSFTGSYLASYLKKKGENRAIREDLDDLLKQVRAVTTTTKEIEAKISTDVWERQKRWELRRDVLFEATRRLGSFEDALLSLHTTRLAERLNRKPGEPEWLEARGKTIDKWESESRNFEETCLLIGVVCGKELKQACDEIRASARQIAVGIFGNDHEIYLKSAPELIKKSVAIANAIRKELGTV